MGACWRATRGCRVTGRRSATARHPSRCTCCGACCVARKPRSERRPSGRPGSPRARLFLALDLPPEARAALFEWCSGAFAGRSDLRPVAADALHVTLVFLGYRPEKEIPAIADAAFSPLAGLPAPLLSARAVVPLPKRRPRLFALDLEDVERRCVELQAACSGALE